MEKGRSVYEKRACESLEAFLAINKVDAISPQW